MNLVISSLIERFFKARAVRAGIIKGLGLALKINTKKMQFKPLKSKKAPGVSPWPRDVYTSKYYSWGEGGKKIGLGPVWGKIDPK